MTENQTMEFTPEALQTIQNMRFHVNRIGAAFGTKSDEYVAASTSLTNSLAQMIANGGTVWREDDLSLGGKSFLAYGIIFHRKRKPETLTDGEAQLWKMVEEANAWPGEWSAHS